MVVKKAVEVESEAANEGWRIWSSSLPVGNNVEWVFDGDGAKEIPNLVVVSVPNAVIRVQIPFGLDQGKDPSLAFV